jgi:hypothetical protein
MSTQRRANRTTLLIEVDRMDDWHGWVRGCMKRADISISAAQTGSALASDITAPLMSIFWMAWAWLRSCGEGSQAPTFRVATNSLYSDHCLEKFAQLESLSETPPREGTGGRRLTVSQATHRPSLLHIPFLPVRTHLRPTLPQAPAGEVRWAERHDGKRDLYFQHAA